MQHGVYFTGLVTATQAEGEGVRLTLENDTAGVLVVAEVQVPRPLAVVLAAQKVTLGDVVSVKCALLPAGDAFALRASSALKLDPASQRFEERNGRQVLVGGLNEVRLSGKLECLEVNPGLFQLALTNDARVPFFAPEGCRLPKSGRVLDVQGHLQPGLAVGALKVQPAGV